ncbi:MAG: hypothetical protein IPN42_09760 [Methylococcaceae bacterium]|nr:hypothetical protein [Methylococcaceae bacterium]
MNNKLDVWKISSGAFLIPWRNRSDFIIALANPILLIAALKVAWFYAKEHVATSLSWGLYIFYIVLFTMLAVTCHRLVLLKIKEVNSWFAFHWSWRETRFLLWLITTMLVSVGLTIILVGILGMLISSIKWSATLDADPTSFILGVVRIISFYFIARLSLVFPAVAVDEKATLKIIWKLGEGNGWRLVIIVGVLPWILTQFPFIFYRANASVLETIVLTVLACMLLVIEITAISLSFYELTKGKKHGIS